jgi:hypothetical protein
VRIQISKETAGHEHDDGGEAPFELGFLWIITPLSHYHVQNRIDGSDDPLCSLIARKPAVFLAEALGRARLEQAENVARQLRPNAAFGTQTGYAYDRSQRAAEVALLIRSGER